MANNPQLALPLDFTDTVSVKRYLTSLNELVNSVANNPNIELLDAELLTQPASYDQAAMQALANAVNDAQVKINEIIYSLQNAKILTNT